MTFKAAIWYPIAIVLSGLNLAGAGYAIALAEPWHAAVHVGLALVFWSWAQRLRLRPDGSERQALLETLDAEMSELRRELNETQERLDFAERMLAQRAETPRAAPER